MSKQEPKIEHLKRIYAQANRDLMVERTRSGLRGRRIEELEAQVEGLREEVEFYKGMSGTPGQH